MPYVKVNSINDIPSMKVTCYNPVTKTECDIKKTTDVNKTDCFQECFQDSKCLAANYEYNTISSCCNEATDGNCLKMYNNNDTQPIMRIDQKYKTHGSINYKNVQQPYIFANQLK